MPPARKAGADPYRPKPGGIDAVARWRERMADEAARTLYRSRGAMVECVHAHERRRGLDHSPVRGVLKACCVALWHALAHDLPGLHRLGLPTAG